MPDLASEPRANKEDVVTMVMPEENAELPKPYHKHEFVIQGMTPDRTLCICGEAKVSEPEQKAIEPEQPIMEEKKKSNAGRPCTYCENKERLQGIVDNYVDACETGENGKPIMPFIEELAIRLKVHRETILEWSKNKADHPEFSDTIKRIQDIQRYRLQQRVLGRYNPTGAIFLLKVNHGMIETEKKILAGDANEPLQVEIIEERITTE